ncbi:MFS transporter [Paenibacillus sp. H1-7]|uniref:MFS transporter n=1 Tax=Paenibacillus sp. H1-7 TaxID=2282849 RepID=UPI001EF9422C|nr:MFS transporter [Paenibacillus sp. H1-7]ULL16298.1 MFS transporter [Paenibacillus sp. H1-7]
MWSNRNVWIVLAGEFIAGLGLWTSIIANLEFMQRHVPSDFMKSLILFVGLLAGVLISPYAGRVIDRSSKKHVLLLSGVGRIISVGFMFLALHFESVWYMVLFAVLLQISAAFYFPTLQAVIPLIVNEKDLLSMNAVHMNAGTVARILGTTLAGLMLTVMSLSTLYTVSLGAYIVLLGSTWLLQLQKPGELGAGKPSQRSSGGFKEMLVLLRSMPNVKRVLWMTIIPTLFIGGFNLMVINVSELQNDPEIKGWLYAAEGIAFIVSGFIVRRLSENGSLMSRLFICSTVIAASQMLLFFGDSKLGAIGSFGLFGLAAGCFIPMAGTFFQKQVPKEYHGRFFSFRSMLDRVMFQVVLLGTGLLLDLIGLQFTALLFGAVSLTLVVYFFAKEAASAEMNKKKQAPDIG